ncbi:MAG: flagellar basal body P-ring formation chaperone FlgA [Planctomycetota bacterium]
MNTDESAAYDEPKGKDALAYTKPHLTRRWLLLGLLLALLTVWAVGMASGQTIHLKRQTTLGPAQITEQGGITLGQIAELEGFGEGEAEVLGSLIVCSVEPTRDRVSLPEVRDALRRAGVNLGLLTIRGFAECRVHRSASETPVNIDEATRPMTPMKTYLNNAEALPRPQQVDLEDSLEEVESRSGLSAASTVRDLVRQHITAALNLPAEQVVCIFEGRDDATLNQSTLGASYEIKPIGDVRLGRMNIRVQRTAGFGDTESDTVGVRIGWRTQVLAATRDIARHERLTEHNVALVDVTLDRNLDGELFTADAIRGAAAASPIRVGQHVRQGDLGQPTLVKRGQAVTVLVRRGRFEMTTTAFAEHDAALHDPVTLRSESRRTRHTKTFRAYVIGPARVTVRHETPTNSGQSTQLAHGG